MYPSPSGTSPKVLTVNVILLITTNYCIYFHLRCDTTRFGYEIKGGRLCDQTLSKSLGHLSLQGETATESLKQHTQESVITGLCAAVEGFSLCYNWLDEWVVLTVFEPFVTE